MQFVSAALTDLGLRRPANEDSHVSRPALGLYAVCDGMGGHTAGEVASRVAADAIESFVQHTDGVSRDFAWPVPFRPELGVDGNRLVSAFTLANRAIHQRVIDEPALRGMATTGVCLLISPASRPDSVPALVAHVGDSRAYLWRDGALEPITRDHSWVEEQISAGVLNEDEARTHPWRNLVTRALAGADDPIVEITPVTMERGDRILICSDGLTSPLTNSAIAEIFARTPTGRPEELSQALVDAANNAGGPDNITVIVVEVT